MKKILALAAILILGQTLVFAQKDKAIAEKDVPARFVKDFNNQAKDAKNVSWVVSPDSIYFMATFTNTDGDLQSLRFGPKGTETRYYVDPQYYPHAIKDTVAHQFAKHSIKSIYIRNLKGKSSYQAYIVRKSGFLFWKHESDAKTISFETDGKMIEVINED